MYLFIKSYIARELWWKKKVKHSKLLQACSAQLGFWFCIHYQILKQGSHSAESNVRWAGLSRGTCTAGAVIATPSVPKGLYGWWD